MRYRSRALLATAALGFISALALMVLTFIVSLKFGEVAGWFRLPGEWLVHLSNQVCPPRGAECFLGSSRRGAQHLWLVVCALVMWSFVLAAAWWAGFRLIERIRARAWTHRRPLFIHRKRGIS